MVTVGRVVFALLQRWLPTWRAYHVLPFALSVVFVLIAVLPHGSPWLGVLALGLAGLACSALLPLTISFGQGQLAVMSASIAGGVIAFYQLGYGIAAFGAGPLQNAGLPLPVIFGGRRARASCWVGLLSPSVDATPCLGTSTPAIDGVAYQGRALRPAALGGPHRIALLDCPVTRSARAGGPLARADRCGSGRGGLGAERHRCRRGAAAAHIFDLHLVARPVGQGQGLKLTGSVAALPLILVMMSPGWSPALAAGPSGTTPATYSPSLVRAWAAAAGGI